MEKSEQRRKPPDQEHPISAEWESKISEDAKIWKTESDRRALTKFLTKCRALVESSQIETKTGTDILLEVYQSLVAQGLNDMEFIYQLIQEELEQSSEFLH